MATLECVATAVPGQPVQQRALRDLAAQIFAEKRPELAAYLPVFENAGIDQRHFVMPLSAYLEPMGWERRSAAFAKHGLELMETAARRALDRAGIRADQVDGIVFVTTTGIATPSLDARLAERLGCRPDLRRVPVWGLGCAGGMAGLRIASDLAEARPGARYLVVALELCSLAFRLDDVTPRAFVANALFADGCAAAIVSSEPSSEAGLQIYETLSHQWPDSERVMGWDVVDDGLAVVFSREIPSRLERDLPDLMRRFLGPLDVDVDHYVLHPGGAKVLGAYAKTLGLDGGQLDDARIVLRDFGNMSSPTVLFVLERLMARGIDDGAKLLMGAVGPGFSAELGALTATRTISPASRSTEAPISRADPDPEPKVAVPPEA